MAVPEQTPYIEHTGNGSSKSFSLGFQCESKDHLIVLIDDIEPPIATWSLTEGNVVFITAPAAGKKITLQRNTPFGRTTDYQSYNNSFRPHSVNGDFDRVWLKLQELGVTGWLLRLYIDRLHGEQKTYIDQKDTQLQNNINSLSTHVDQQDAQLQQNIDNLKTYVDDKDNELRAYLMEEIRKQGVALDQLDEYYNYLMQRLAQIAVDKGWDASFVVSASGETQQEVNDYNGAKWRNKVAGYELNSRVMLDNGSIVRSIVANNTTDPNLDMTGWVRGSTVKLSDLGAKPDPDFDSAIAWKAINDALSDGDTLIIDIDNYVSSYVEITKQINIDNRATTYVNAGVANALIVFSAPLSRTISGSALSVLPKKGDSQLHFTTLDFDPTDYLVILESTEITTVRVGQIDSYTKQEINEFVTHGCILRDTVLHDYTDASKLQIKLIKKTQQNTYTNFKVKLFNSAGATQKNAFVEFRRLYGKTIVNLQVSKEGSEHVIGSGVKFADCAEFTWIAPTLSKFNTSAEPTYPLFNIRSGFMLFIKPVYTDGVDTLRKERGYGGRHGRNINFIMPQLGGIDDHWGHNYVVEKATFTTRGVDIAGGSLTLRDCDSFGVALVGLRGDTPYADGTLTLDNCSSDYALIYSSHYAVDEQPTTYKHWDKVRIINSKPCTTKASGGVPMVAINCIDPSQVNTVLKTDLEIDTIEFKNGTTSGNSSLIRFSRDQGWLRKLTLKNIKDTTTVEPTQFRPLIQNIECDILDVSDCEDFTWSNVTTGDFTIKGGTVGNNSEGIVYSTITRMGRFSTDFSNKFTGTLSLQTSFTAKLFFTSCIFDTLKVFESTTVKNQIEFMSGNIVGSSLSTFNSPVDIYHYVKPTAHKQRYATITIYAQTIVSNSATERYDITVAGAKVGDVVDVSPSGSLNGCDVIAYVTADDTVSYQINNNSKYSAAISTQTLTFRVRSI